MSRRSGAALGAAISAPIPICLSPRLPYFWRWEVCPAVLLFSPAGKDFGTPVVGSGDVLRNGISGTRWMTSIFFFPDLCFGVSAGRLSARDNPA